MTLRTLKVSAAHAETLRALHVLTFPDDDHEDYLDGHWWIVYDAGAPVAFAGMRQAVTSERSVYLSRCGVLASHRGQGIQRTLLRRRLAYAKSLWSRAISTTYQNRQSANNLIGAGFRLYDPETPWGSDGTLYWAKEFK